LPKVRSTVAEAAAAAAEGGTAGLPTAAIMEAEAVVGAAWRSRAGGRKGPVIERAPSRASPSERRLLCRMALTATKIHRPSPNCAAGCGRTTSCRGVHRGVLRR
jgi:hypothetical protein